MLPFGSVILYGSHLWPAGVKLYVFPAISGRGEAVRHCPVSCPACCRSRVSAAISMPRRALGPLCFRCRGGMSSPHIQAILQRGLEASDSYAGGRKVRPPVRPMPGSGIFPSGISVVTKLPLQFRSRYAEGVTVLQVTIFKTLLEPVVALLGRAVGEGFRHHVALRLLLEVVIADL
jgi:hypothetical protein